MNKLVEGKYIYNISFCKHSNFKHHNHNFFCKHNTIFCKNYNLPKKMFAESKCLLTKSSRWPRRARAGAARRDCAGAARRGAAGEEEVASGGDDGVDGSGHGPGS